MTSDPTVLDFQSSKFSKIQNGFLGTHLSYTKLPSQHPDHGKPHVRKITCLFMAFVAHKGGFKNNCRNLLKEIVGELLPNGNLLWKADVAQYQWCSGKLQERDASDTERYRRFKMGTNYHKPTRVGGAKKDFISQCSSKRMN